MRAPVVTFAAAVLVLEGAVLAVVALLEMFGLGSGDAASLPMALALIVLTLIGAAGLFAFAFAVYRGLSWGRSGGIVVQVLALAVAFSAATTVDPIPMPFVLGVGLAGLIGFILLIASARRDGDRDPRVAHDDTEN